MRDGNIITGAGVSAGMDFGASLVAQLRNQPLAEIATLIAEYAPSRRFRLAHSSAHGQRLQKPPEQCFRPLFKMPRL
jgi:hypothetical protein